MIDCSHDKKTVTVKQFHNRFKAYEGRDVWHPEISVQVRLNSDGTVFLSTEETHVSTLRIASMTFREFYELIKTVTHAEKGK